MLAPTVRFCFSPDSGNGGYYLIIISRIIERRRILGQSEKEVFRAIMRKVEGFSRIRILTWTAMGSHWHILLYVPPREDVSDIVFLERLGFLYEPEQVKGIAGKLAKYRENGPTASAELLKVEYTYRMYDLSEFCKTLKQRFSQYYNRSPKASRSAALTSSTASSTSTEITSGPNEPKAPGRWPGRTGAVYALCATSGLKPLADDPSPEE